MSTSKEEKAAERMQAKLDAAQDPSLPDAPADAMTFEGGTWHAMPHRKLMERVAYQNHGTWQGNLDWLKGSTPLGAKLEPVATAFCDGIVLKCLVPPEQVTLTKPGDNRTAKYNHFGMRCQTIRQLLRDAGLVIEQNDVTGARLFKADAGNERKSGPARLPKDYEITSDTVPNRGAGAPPVAKKEWWWQHFLVHLTDKKNGLQKVIDFVRAGEFAKHGIWLNDFDVTWDCKGVIDCQRFKEWLSEKTNGTFVIDAQECHGADFDSDFSPRTKHGKTVLNNAHKVGLNCVSWMQTDAETGLQVRLKVYLKLVQQFEKKEVRDTCGHHIHDVIEAFDTRLADATEATEDTGLLRSESTVYVDKASIPISKAHLSLPATAEEVTEFCAHQLEIVPKWLVRRAPHALMIQNWAQNLKHTLVVVDRYSNECLVALTKNEVTGTIAGTYVTNYKDRSKHIMQKLVLGDHPVDVIELHRGSAETSIPQVLPEPKSRVELDGAKALKAKRAASKKQLEWVDRDMDWPDINVAAVGSKRDVDGAVVREPPDDSSDSGGDVDTDDCESEDEAEVEMDDEAKVAIATEAARKEEREKIAAERAAAAAIEAAADSVSTVDAGEVSRYKVPMGGLVVTTSRYHRIPTNPDKPNPTEFPRGGGLEHYFKLPVDPPGIQPLLTTAATPAVLAKRNQIIKLQNKALCVAASTEWMEERLTMLGLRDHDNLASLNVQPRLEPSPISQKVSDAFLMDTESKLTLDMNSIAGATKLLSFMTDKRQINARLKRKENLLLQRQTNRLHSIAIGKGERPMLIESGKRRSASSAAKEHLRAAYGQKEARSLRTNLEPGTYPLVAVRIREQKAGSSDRFDIILRVDDALLAFKGVQNISDAFNAKKDELQQLYNAIGGDPYYMHHDCTIEPIGVLTLADSNLRAVNGKPIVDCAIAIGDIRVLETQAGARERHAVEASPSDAAEMEVEAGPSTPPPQLLVTDALKRTLGSKDYIGNKFDVDRKAKFYEPRVLLVHKMGITKHYQHEAVLLEVQEDIPGAQPVILWGGETLNKRAGELTLGCRIVVHKVKAKNALDAKIIAEVDWHWTQRLPTNYSAIKHTIQKGEHAGQPPQIRIQDCFDMPCDGGRLDSAGIPVAHPVILDSEGKIWRFLAPQSVKAVPAKNQPGLALVAGGVLDTVLFTVNTPAPEP